MPVPTKAAPADGTGGHGSHILDQRAMTARQYMVVAITILLNALDGFDVLSISFASPGIAADWGIDRAALGIILSMELIGMAIGSVLLGRAGDRFGRRPTALVCLVLMAAGMFLASTASGLIDLSAWRVLTGVGIGGMLAVTNAITSEVANARHRSLSVSLMVIGYPVGAILGGVVTAWLLRSNDWRVIFEFGALCTMAMIPIVNFGVPETPAFILARRGDNALARLNHALAKLGHAPLTELPGEDAKGGGGRLRDLFAGGLRRNTVLLTLAYFAHIVTFYFILKWVPKIVVDMGFVASAAAGVLVWANVGGALGGALFGFSARRWPLQRLCLTAFLASAVMVVIFGQAASNLAILSLLAALGGFCTNAAMVGLYNLAAVTFPTDLRSTGTGLVIGIGRGGAVLGPPLAGLLFDGGWGLPAVALVMAAGSIVALCLVAAMRWETAAR